MSEKLGWPTRNEALSLTVAEHARKFGIEPTYDLDDPSPQRGKRRSHQWQTLLAEDELERRMRALELQARESREEYGVETLFLILGFLEWKEKTPDGESETRTLSPLLLVPVGVEKKGAERLSRKVDDRLLIGDGTKPLSRVREIYTIQGGADDPTSNLCLKERLRQDFGIELPDWSEDLGFEHFFQTVAEAIDGRDGWKVRSYATLSHLTFNRLAMWADLDPGDELVDPPYLHPVLGELFGEKSAVT